MSTRDLVRSNKEWYRTGDNAESVTDLRKAPCGPILVCRVAYSPPPPKLETLGKTTSKVASNHPIILKSRLHAEIHLQVIPIITCWSEDQIGTVFIRSLVIVELDTYPPGVSRPFDQAGPLQAHLLFQAADGNRNTTLFSQL